jgi:hypothetical protein
MSLNILRTTFGLRKISLKSAGPLGLAGHCSPSHSCTENSRGPKRINTVFRSERADASTAFVIAVDVVVMILSSLDEVQPTNRKESDANTTQVLANALGVSGMNAPWCGNRMALRAAESAR